jgi:hypothetical protein
MNLTRAVGYSALVLLIVVCAATFSSGVASARDRSLVPAQQTAGVIDAILYGDFSREEILQNRSQKCWDFIPAYMLLAQSLVCCIDWLDPPPKADSGTLSA